MAYDTMHKALRAEGISNTAVADLLHIHRHTVRNRYNGRGRFSPVELSQIYTEWLSDQPQDEIFDDLDSATRRYVAAVLTGQIETR